jgi:5-methylcytosine-specific restriction endonuclease McrA
MPYDQTFSGTIPADVKSEVWQRDGGKCVKCGSQEQLLFDQTIPVKDGAVITAANIKIVCKVCNQKIVTK